MSPRVTIITPAYNAADLIGATLASAAAQTMTDFEHLVIDDGSTDDTAALVARVAQDDPRLRLIALEQNHGAPAGPRNIGIREAKGEWIALLDADDLWHPDKLADQLALAEREAVDFVCSRMRDFVGSPPPWQAPATGLASHEITLLGQKIKGRIPASSVLIRRQLLLEHPFEENLSYKAVEDVHCWLRVLKSRRCMKLDFPYLAYRRIAGQISGSKLYMAGRIFMVHRETSGLIASLGFMVTYFVVAVYLRVFRQTL